MPFWVAWPSVGCIPAAAGLGRGNSSRRWRDEFAESVKSRIFLLRDMKAYGVHQYCDWREHLMRIETG